MSVNINYIEIPCRDLPACKAFFTAAFAWTFVDYGPDYTAFAGQGLDGGFFRSDQRCRQANGSVLVVFYSPLLESTMAQVLAAGGEISQSIFSFPGGRRFHFFDPVGNEYAVWSDKELSQESI